MVEFEKYGKMHIEISNATFIIPSGVEVHVDSECIYEKLFTIDDPMPDPFTDMINDCEIGEHFIEIYIRSYPRKYVILEDYFILEENRISKILAVITDDISSL